MWKFQHLDGQREINELHVPVGRAVRLTGTSEDVIHSFFVPAFRMKADVLPGRYTTLWFNATKPGRYHLFCAEYCGTQHSGMIGTIVVMEPTEYQAWLSGGASEGSLASQGREAVPGPRLHHLPPVGRPGPGAEPRGPVRQHTWSWPTVAGRAADEAYIRESILSPSAKVVAGFQPIMPTFQGLVSEEQLIALVEYIKSLKGRPIPQPATPHSARQPARPRLHGAPVRRGSHRSNDTEEVGTWTRIRSRSRARTT